MVSVLTKLFGFDRLDEAQDLVHDTFVTAYETWKLKGTPENPTAWLYKVAKNKAFDYVRRQQTFQKVVDTITPSLPHEYSIVSHLEMQFQKITDSQLQMLFAVSHPEIPPESQVALALKTLGGFSIKEIASAFITQQETITKRLYRAKQRIKKQGINLEMPPDEHLTARLDSVLESIYLMFTEGYHSASQESVVRKDLCLEAMRLCLMLVENEKTAQPKVHALMALMCFHSSRFDSRISESGDLLAWQDQDQKGWNQELIDKGQLFLKDAAVGDEASSYHLEAMMAYWHTQPDSVEKWRELAWLYDHLLAFQDNPMVRLNRVYVLHKTEGSAMALAELEKLEGLQNHHLYFVMKAELLKKVDLVEAKIALDKAIELCPLEAEKNKLEQWLLSM